jgi:phage repressor protein C with HTH and peptisase S24 domain
MKTFADRLKRLRTAAGLTQAEMAKRLEVSRGALANWEVGGEIARDNIRRISQEFDTSLDWLEGGRGKPPHILATIDLAQSMPQRDSEQPASQGHRPNASIGPRNGGGWREVPVYGQAVAGEDGEFLMNGDVLFRAFAPPQVVEIADAYGVRVSGISMEPRYFDGEVVFVDPSRHPRAGDFVVVQVRPDDNSAPWGYIKRYVRRNTKELVLTQLNPDKQLTFRNDDVLSVHVIVMGGMG